VLAAVAGSALAAGCATATLDVIRPVPVRLDAVALTLHDDSSDAVTPDQMRELQRIVTRELLAAGIDVLPWESRLDVVRVEGSIERYDPGIRALRFVSHYGFGTGSLVTEWDVESQRSNSLARCRVDGSVSMGTFGGSFGDVERETGKALARCLKGELR
jgi:hypothetical protein